jgi:hypothetical protein
MKWKKRKKKRMNRKKRDKKSSTGSTSQKRKHETFTCFNIIFDNCTLSVALDTLVSSNKSDYHIPD